MGYPAGVEPLRGAHHEDPLPLLGPRRRLEELSRLIVDELSSPGNVLVVFSLFLRGIKRPNSSGGWGIEFYWWGRLLLFTAGGAIPDGTHRGGWMADLPGRGRGCTVLGGPISGTP